MLPYESAVGNHCVTIWYEYPGTGIHQGRRLKSYGDWFNRLDAQAAAKMAVVKLRMEMGNTSAIKWFQGIVEFRIDWGPGYRIYLAKDGDTLIVLFGGGTKKTQARDIERAKDLYDEYKARKKAMATDTRKKR